MQPLRPLVVEEAVRHVVQRQRLIGLVTVGALGERAGDRVHQRPHVRVDVVQPPVRHSQRRVEAQELPGTPDRVQSGQRLGVPEPGRAPHAPGVRTGQRDEVAEPVGDELEDVRVEELALVRGA